MDITALVSAVVGSSALAAVVTGYFTARAKAVDSRHNAENEIREDLRNLLKDEWEILREERLKHHECLERVKAVERELLEVRWDHEECNQKANTLANRLDELQADFANFIAGCNTKD